MWEQLVSVSCLGLLLVQPGRYICNDKRVQQRKGCSFPFLAPPVQGKVSIVAALGHLAGRIQVGRDPRGCQVWIRGAAVLAGVETLV